MIRNKKAALVLILIIPLLMSSCIRNLSPLIPILTNGMVDADHPYIEYGGRFDQSDPKKAIFDWPGVYIKLTFEGTSCQLRLKDANNYYDITVDNQAAWVLKMDTATIFPLATNLKDTIHTVLIQKRTETFVGKGEFYGFIIDEGKNVILPNPSDRRMEFIGNSITCGYGVEAPSASSPFKNETENAGLSYAALIGRALNADYAMIAYSGRGLVRNYGDKNKTSNEPMPSLYDRTCCADLTPVWDFTSWIPQVVVINLGTNDFSTKPHPDTDVFKDGYTQLINRIQSNYPDVTIFCICGPLIGDPCGTYIDEVVTQCQANNENKKVHYISIQGILDNSDFGADWHPNIVGQQKTANVILPVIQDKMNW